MKRSILLISFVLLLLTSGCSMNSRLTIPSSVDEISSIEVYTGSVPADAYKKTVTKSDDFQTIYNSVKTLHIGRKATEADYVSGGIGTTLLFRLNNGEQQIIYMNSNMIYTSTGYHIIHGESLDTDNFWYALNYGCIKVGEEDLPLHK